MAHRLAQRDKTFYVGRVGAQLEHKLIRSDIDNLGAEDIAQLDESDAVHFGRDTDLDKHKVPFDDIFLVSSNCDHDDGGDVLQLLVNLPHHVR
jgi:hypothetical protein